MTIRAKRCIRFVVGVFLGIVDTLIYWLINHRDMRGVHDIVNWQSELMRNFYVPNSIREVFRTIFQLELTAPYILALKVLTVAAEVAIALLLGRIFTNLIWSYTPSTKIDKYTIILECFLGALVWLPVTEIIMSYLLVLIKFLVDNFYVQRIMYNLLYGLMYVEVANLLGEIYTKKLSAEKRRCKLEICRVSGEETYVVERVLMTKRKFQDCFDVMRDYPYPGKDRFYLITELTFTGKDIVTTWRYYADGAFTDLSEKNLCRKIHERIADGEPAV